MKRKEKKYIKLGEDFEVVDSVGTRGNYYSLGQCYNNCSTRKHGIYNYYYDMLREHAEVIKYGVASYNCNIITLEAFIRLRKKYYSVYITPTKNLISEVVVYEA